jgi:hypothetical protein
LIVFSTPAALDFCWAVGELSADEATGVVCVLPRSSAQDDLLAGQPVLRVVGRLVEKFDEDPLTCSRPPARRPPLAASCAAFLIADARSLMKRV